MITSINFADASFRTQQKWNTRSAKLLGGIDRVVEYGPQDIDSIFMEESQAHFEHSKKGFGGYFWKPYLLKKTFDELKEGDYLVYSDSGTVFVKNIKPLLNYMDAQGKSVFCFSLPLIEKQFTKRDAFVLMDCDTEEYANKRQISANFFILKKDAESTRFLNAYYEYSKDYRILTDAPNTQGLPNYPEFLVHRHDQSIISLLSKKLNALVEGDVSDYAHFPTMYVHNPKYIYDKEALKPENHKFKGYLLSNRKEHPLVWGFKYYVRLALSKLGINLKGSNPLNV